jgi:hypothetical protein
MQDQANAAGNLAAGTYSDMRINDEVSKQTDYDKIARDAVKDVDTSEFKSLEENN